VIVIDIKSEKSTLYIPEYGESYEIWSGPPPSVESIIAKTGVDQIRSDQEFDEALSDLLGSCIFTAPGNVRLPSNVPLEHVDLSSLLRATGIARTIKTKDEISDLRIASSRTAQAIVRVWKDFAWHENMCETEVEALFQYHGAMLGCKYVSFLTICGSGPNSVYLHYSKNTGPVRKGDLILLDCGLFYNHYAGDITRTFPASGKFSAEQRLVYSSLLRGQIELCNMVKPGVDSKTLSNAMCEKVFEVLRDCGVVTKDAPFSNSLARLFCPHGLSHHIGVNVHDQCFHEAYQKSPIADDRSRLSVLKPGMVISIEPGIYFHSGRLQKITKNPQSDLPEFDIRRAFELADLVGGIRIEDDVLVTEDGSEILSRECPKTVEEIEALLRR
jgi:Xaa-Pro aminopeptidase